MTNLSNQLDNILATAKQPQPPSLTPQRGSTKSAGQLITANYTAPRSVEASNQMVKDLLINCKSLKALPKPSLQIGSTAPAPDMYRVTPEDYQQLETALAVIENVILKPIEINALSGRINSFASLYHFAFGDKIDRPVTIANWIDQLSSFPEWAVAQALDDVKDSYSSGILTIATVKDRLKYYLGDAYAKRDKIKHIFRHGQIFRTQQEYADWQEAQRQKRFEQRQAAERQQAEKHEVAKKFEQLREEMQAPIDVEDEAIIERKEQAESIKNTMQKFKDNARLVELYEEFEELRKKLGGE